MIKVIRLCVDCHLLASIVANQLLFIIFASIKRSEFTFKTK